jgi:hypothetical protein
MTDPTNASTARAVRHLSLLSETVAAVHQSHRLGVYRQGGGIAIAGQPTVVKIAVKHSEFGGGGAAFRGHGIGSVASMLTD